LAKNPHTAALSLEDRAALASAMALTEHPDGHVFIKEGERGETLFFLLDGEVVVTRARSGDDRPIKRLHAGELFGLIALVDHEPRSATCRAAGEVHVASLPRSAFSQLFHSHLAIADALQRALAAQLTDDFRNVSRQLREELTKSQS
jgi:CRP-like cAMP-binding protein